MISIRKPILLTKMIIDRTADEYPNSVSREYLHNLIESLRVLLDHDVKASDVHQMSIVLGNTWRRESGE